LAAPVLALRLSLHILDLTVMLRASAAPAAGSERLSSMHSQHDGSWQLCFACVARTMARA